jgi:hypothetical protein
MNTLYVSFYNPEFLVEFLGFFDEGVFLFSCLRVSA